MKASVLSLNDRPQGLDVQRLLPCQLPAAAILLFKGREAAQFLADHAPVQGLPAVEGLFADAFLATDLGDLPGASGSLRSARSMTFPLAHRESSCGHSSSGDSHWRYSGCRGKGQIPCTPERQLIDSATAPVVRSIKAPMFDHLLDSISSIAEVPQDLTLQAEQIEF